MTGSPSGTLRGISLMILGIFVVSVMDALIKWMSASFPSIQIIFFRSLFGLIPLFAIIAFKGGLAALKTRRPGAQFLRALFGVGAMIGFFVALAKLGLAEATALAFSSPLFVTLLSMPLLGERVGPRRFAAVAIGFVGVLIVMRPGSEVFTVWALFPILASFCFAMTMLLARRMSDTETGVSMTFYTTLGGIIVGAVGTPSVWVTPSLPDWPLFLLIGLFGGVGQFMITSAFRYVEAVVAAPFEYTALLWAVLLGFLFWGEVPDNMTVVGAVIVVGAGLYIGYRETRLKT